MRFEISYRGGTTHEVELPGSVAVLGRDPGCDVVLNDSKCSRRHAVVEDGPEGVVVRDSDSANGIFVNGRKVDRAVLAPGDTVRLGDVRLTLLPEIGATIVVASEDLDLAAPPRLEVGEPAPTPAPAAPTPGAGPAPPVLARTAPRRAPAAPRSARPATVGVLAALWALFAPASVAATLFAASRAGGTLTWVAAALVGLALAALGVAMAVGLRALAPWARHLQIAAAALGLLACPFTLAAATVLIYMGRPEVKAAFEGGRGGPAPTRSGPSEATFALSLVGMLVLGFALTAAAAFLVL